jgi:FtsH-binding integral membrane protein
MSENNPFEIKDYTPNQKYTQDLEKGNNNMNCCTNYSSRQIFIMKTYVCLAIQLFITFGITLAFFKSPTLQSATTDQLTTLLWVFFCIAIVAMCLTLFGVAYLQSNLCATIPFILFTFAMSVVFAVGAIQYSISTAIQSIACVSLIFFSCTAFIFITKKDLHSWGGILYCSLLTLIVTSIVFIFFPPSNLVYIVYNAVGIVIFIGYVLFDTSEIIHTYEENEYFIASMNIYLDLLNLLLKFMAVIDWLRGEKKN